MSRSVTLIRADRLTDVGQYAHAAVPAPGARMVFLAGACPLDEHGNTIGLGSPALQAARAMDNLEIALEAAGAALDDVVQTRVLVASSRQEDLVAAWEAVRARFGDHDAPSTLVGVAALGYTGQLVEVEAVAAVLPQLL
jgi:enamine deaminase RidA (YjgF/YER057c/UK114 family)